MNKRTSQMTYMEAMHVAVPEAIWEAAKNGDESAKILLKQEINNITIYEHILPLFEGEVVITLDDLLEVFPKLFLTISFPN